MGGFSRPEFESGVLYRLSIAGKNVIRPWGVEFADSSTFFSLEEGFGYRYSVLDFDEEKEGQSRILGMTVRLKEGLVRLELEEKLQDPNTILRSSTLTCLENTVLMDFVLRYRFLAREFPLGYIAGRTIPFGSSSVYHQYPVTEAAVGNRRYSLQVMGRAATVPKGMRPMAYLRCGEDEWVLHLRMVPEDWDKEVIKLCSHWFGTRPLPQWMSTNLLQIPPVREFLWYKGEQRPWKNRFLRIFSPSAYPMIQMKEGQQLEWVATCTVGPPGESVPRAER